jgi:hypothetical protein
MDTEQEDPNRSLQLDFRCSNSCTRAGLTALLFAALAFAMLWPLEKAKQFDALGKYASLRLELKDSLDQLGGEPCWKVLLKTEGDKVLNWTLSKLMEFRCGRPPAPKEGKPDKPPPSGSQKEEILEKPRSNSKGDEIAPETPTGFMVWSESTIWEFDRIADILSELGNGELLKLARSYSHRFDRSIYRWEMLRYRILQENRGGPPVSTPPSKSRGKDPDRSREEQIKYFRLENLRRLGDYELPELGEIEPLLKELSHFSLPSLGMPVGLIAATHFIELGLVFMLVYFWVFQREAKLSRNYPAPGTLFGAFKRTFISRNMFKVFIALPAVAATLLAIESFSYTYWNTVFAVFVVGFSIIIALDWSRNMEADLLKSK